MATNSTSPTPKHATAKVAPRHGQVKENRDPNGINKELTIDFYSVFAEPSLNSSRSFDCVWELSETFYDCFHHLCYKLFTLFCGICIAIYWGLKFVPFILLHVWVCTPIHACFHMICGVWGKTCVTICTRCCIKPFCQSCSVIFRFCGRDGSVKPFEEDTPIFPNSKRRPPPVVTKKVEQEPTPAPVVAVVRNSSFDYDKEKVARSVRRQLML